MNSSLTCGLTTLVTAWLGLSCSLTRTSSKGKSLISVATSTSGLTLCGSIQAFPRIMTRLSADKTTGGALLTLTQMIAVTNSILGIIPLRR